MTNGLIKAMVAVVGLALAIRLAYELVMPVVPALAFVAIAFGLIYIAWLLRRRDRW